LCDYFSNPVFRREIHTILNRGESVHQLQRAVYFGKVAPERGRQHDEMMAISGSHTLLTNLVLAWNTHRMQETVDRWRVPVGVRDQLKNLIAIVEKLVEPPPVPDAQPTYDPSGLGFAVQRAADSFQKAWAARLGLVVGVTLPAEHWRPAGFAPAGRQRLCTAHDTVKLDRIANLMRGNEHSGEIICRNRFAVEVTLCLVAS
jgi:hypothetical protein